MFPYIGGKAHHIKWLDPLFPSDSKKFVEVFGGAGWVSVKSKSILSASERIYNDFNPLLANVYECLRLDSDRVLELMNNTPKSNLDIYKTFQKELFVDLDWSSVKIGDFELAMKYLYLQTQVFAGTPLSANNVAYFCDIKSNGKYNSKYETLKNKLNNKEIKQRLKDISKVEHLDCLDLIKKYDNPETFFYVDPPYYKMEFYYSKDFPREKHKELAELLSTIKGKFALSYYDFDDLKLFYPEDQFYWHRQTVYRSAATRSGNDDDYSEKSKGTEILIMNYVPNVEDKSIAVKNKKKKNQITTFEELFETQHE